MIMIKPWCPISLASLITLFIGFWPAASHAQVNTDTFQGFRDWCQHREQLSREEQHTVETILNVVVTDDCNRAEEMLSSLSALVLIDRQIESLTPLTGLTNLRSLWLNNNQITDISALASLTALEQLWLHENQIQDLSPLNSLVNLELLDLAKNNITDIRPLHHLTQLTQLSLFENQIEDGAPLANLSALKTLNLESSGISSLDAVASLVNLTNLSLDFEQIDRWQSLASLANLTQLSVNQAPTDDSSRSPSTRSYYRALSVPFPPPRSRPPRRPVPKRILIDPIPLPVVPPRRVEIRTEPRIYIPPYSAPDSQYPSSAISPLPPPPPKDLSALSSLIKIRPESQIYIPPSLKPAPPLPPAPVD